MGFLSKLKRAIIPLKPVRKAADKGLAVLKSSGLGGLVGLAGSVGGSKTAAPPTAVDPTTSGAYSPLTHGGGVTPLFGQVPPDNFFQSPTALAAFAQSLQAPQSGYMPVGFGNGGGNMGMQQMFANINNRSMPEWGNRGSPGAPAVIFDPSKYAF